MAWALVSTIEMTIPVGEWVGSGMQAQYIITNMDAPIGTIINLIAYDGESPYTPPEGTKIEEVPDTAKVGDTGY